MANVAGNAIITKAKAIYRNRLKPEDYEELLKYNSISDIVGYLKRNQKFENTLSDVDEYSIHRGQLENMIRKSYFDNLTRLVKFVSTPDKKFYELDMIRREIEIVLSSIRAVISASLESSIRDLPMFFQKHASFDIEDVTKAMTMRDLLESLKDTRYHTVLERFYTDLPEEIRYSDIEYALYLQYHEIVLERINKYYKGKNHEILMNMYQSKVEVENIVKIYRMKKFYNASGPDIMKAIMTEDIRMSKQKLRELINAEDADDILQALSDSDMSEYKDEDGFIYIEYQAGKIKYNLAKRFMYFSTFPPIVYNALLFLNDIERTNLFNIIEGIRYDIAKEDIKKLLIY